MRCYSRATALTNNCVTVDNFGHSRPIAYSIQDITYTTEIKHQEKVNSVSETNNLSKLLCSKSSNIPGANITGYQLTPNGLPSDGLLQVIIPGSCDWGPVRYISRYNCRDPLDDLICKHFGYM
ncbi:hypothetical protein DPMN_068403 [Dreissena polymorpha]|uniref:Uncharacterized protein n=1 Tax=Dreissena polymorpha TaxID=45954 RepID=A0A9D3YX36_DREPO|nr:hypothetical protein DPMN_068403 [Dreissena polymorpha]